MIMSLIIRADEIPHTLYISSERNLETEQQQIVAKVIENLGQMAVNQPDLVDLCFSSGDDDSSFGEVDSSYDSILVLSQSDDPLPQVPWRFGKATRHDNVGTNHLSLHI